VYNQAAFENCPLVSCTRVELKGIGLLTSSCQTLGFHEKTTTPMYPSRLCMKNVPGAYLCAWRDGSVVGNACDELPRCVNVVRWWVVCVW
jgi:hypothetical protein